MKIGKRLLSLLLCFVMLVGLMPTTAFAWTAPTLSGDGGGTWDIQLSAEGVLSWNEQQGATSYDIEVDKTATGGTVTKIENINAKSYNLIDRFKELKIENGTYYFQIKANGPNTTSNTISFRYISPEPKLPAPLNLRWDGTTAKWDSVANATEYEVKLYTAGGSVQLTKTTSNTEWDWSTEAADGRWFEVVAKGNNYRNSNSAESPKYGNYIWTAPALSGGKSEWGITLSNDGMLRWNDMGSATYDIYVDKTALGGTVTNIYNINTNAYNLINRLKDLKIENGSYCLYIKENDTDNTSGDITFRYVSPEVKLSAPQNLYWDGTVAKWGNVANADEYEVKLYTASGNVQLTKTTSDTEWDWTTEATDGRWFEVVATGNGYRNSNVSESPKYIVVGYNIGAYPYDATISQTQAGGQVYLTTDNGTNGWSSDGYIKKATEGTTVTLNANPAAGYKFVEWRQGTAGATISTEANYQFTASEDKYLYAVFETISSTTYNIELGIFDETYTATDGGTVSIQANGGSSVSGSGVIGHATENTAVTITAVPKQGYEFVAWKKWTPYASASFSTDATYTFVATNTVVDPSENPPLFLYAVFQQAQQIVPTYEINCVAHNLSSNEIGGKVFLETDKGGTGYATSQQQYATENTTVRLRAVAEPGYQFVAWRKGSPTDANAAVSTNAEHEFTATEAVWMYAVFEYTADCTIECIPFDITGGINNGQSGVGGTVSIQTDKGTASGTITQSLKATRNSSVTVNAVAASGYEFLGWKKASPYVQDFVATTASYTFNINEELYLYAVFQEAANVPTYTVSFVANGGTGSMADATGISGEYTLPANGFTAPNGMQFKAWSVGGAEKAVGDKITVTANTTVTAVWENIPQQPTTYTVTVNNGTGDGDYTEGANVTITANAPENGKQFKEWTGADNLTFTSGSKITATATFTMPAEAVTVTATYEDIPQQPTATLTDIVITTPPTKTTYTAGESFDPTGMVVMAYYSDQSSRPLSNNEYTYAPAGALTANDTEITVTYDDGLGTIKTAEQAITVSPAQPTGHTHDYGQEPNNWDATHHWKECNDQACPDLAGSIKDKAPHADSGGDGRCDDCDVDLIKISFAPGEGTGTMAAVYVTLLPGSVSYDFTLPANGFTAPSGKSFKCWSVGGSEKAVGAVITVADDTTVTAAWMGNTYNPRPNYPIYINPTPGSSSTGQITAAKTFDGGIGLSVAVTILSAMGGAWLAKKKED